MKGPGGRGTLGQTTLLLLDLAVTSERMVSAQRTHYNPGNVSWKCTQQVRDHGTKNGEKSMRVNGCHL
eukprot:1160962-Pelagomonas_calceolata.AAC.7